MLQLGRKRNKGKSNSAQSSMHYKGARRGWLFLFSSMSHPGGRQGGSGAAPKEKRGNGLLRGGAR